MAEIDENVESTYQIFKKRSKDKNELKTEILKYVNGIYYKDPDSANTIKKLLLNKLNIDTDFKE